MQALIILLDFVHICLLKFNIITLSNLERGYILSRPVFLKSGQLVTGQTSLIYKGNDGTSRIINPDNYQPKGSYAVSNHSHNGANLSFDSTRSINDVINNNYSMIVNANNEISSLKTSVSNGKSAVASAITDKGVSTSATASFNTMANNIRKINQNAPILLYTNNNVSAGMENYKTNITLPSVNYNAFLIEFKYTSMQAYGSGSTPVGDPNNSAIIYYTKSQLNTGAVAYVSGNPTTQRYSTYRRDMKLTNNILYCGDAGHQDSYHPHLDSKYLCIPSRIWGIDILL